MLLADTTGQRKWEFSSAGRASALQAECQQFDPVSAHQLPRIRPLDDSRGLFWFFVKFWGAKVSMHSWRGHALNTVRVLFRCVC